MLLSWGMWGGLSELTDKAVGKGVRRRYDKASSWGCCRRDAQFAGDELGLADACTLFQKAGGALQRRIEISSSRSVNVFVLPKGAQNYSERRITFFHRYKCSRLLVRTYACVTT